LFFKGGWPCPSGLLGVPNQHRSEGARDTLTDAGLLKGGGVFFSNSSWKSHHRYNKYVKVITTIRPVTIPVIIPVTICNSM
jgi:hypothetical protein